MSYDKINLLINKRIISKMENNKTFTIRTSGFGAVFIWFMSIWFIPIMFWASIDGFINGSIIIGIGALLLNLIVGYDFYLFLFENKIELSNDKMSNSYQVPGNSIITKFNKNTIAISDIEYIMIGKLAKLEKLAETLNSEALNETLSFWHNARLTLTPTNGIGGFRIPIWAAARETPMLFIKCKDNKSYVISTKPFSKNSFKKLVIELRNRKIPVTTDPSLGIG